VWACKDGDVKPIAAALVCLMTLIGTISVAPMAGSASSAHGAAQCMQIAMGQAKVTKAGIASCQGSSFNNNGHCPKGSGLTFVRMGHETFALHVGQKPQANANRQQCFGSKSN
jgi:hypothetical protein